jgi:hypothetical protein
MPDEAAFGKLKNSFIDLWDEDRSFEIVLSELDVFCFFWLEAFCILSMGRFFWSD